MFTFYWFGSLIISPLNTLNIRSLFTPFNDPHYAIILPTAPTNHFPAPHHMTLILSPIVGLAVHRPISMQNAPMTLYTSCSSGLPLTQFKFRAEQPSRSSGNIWKILQEKGVLVVVTVKPFQEHRAVPGKVLLILHFQNSLFGLLEDF